MAAQPIAATRSEAVFNGIVNKLSTWGISIKGSRLLAVRGRKSGEWRTTTVNPLTLDGTRYLVAPRGNTQWVRNLRANTAGELRLGRKTESFTAIEVPDADKVPVLRVYLKNWGWEVGKFLEGVTAKSTDDQLAAIAPDFPVFRIS
jgi:deazaflavin-dependent oxidoreductase (nitroreductase family)